MHSTRHVILNLFGGSWDLVSKVIGTLSGVISVVILIITAVTKSHDPLSTSLAQLVGSGLKDVSIVGPLI